MSACLDQHQNRANPWKHHTEDNHSIGDSQEGLKGSPKERGPSESSTGKLTDPSDSFHNNLLCNGTTHQETTSGLVRSNVGFLSTGLGAHQSDQCTHANRAAESSVYACNKTQVDEIGNQTQLQAAFARDIQRPVKYPISMNFRTRPASEILSRAALDYEFMDSEVTVKYERKSSSRATRTQSRLGDVDDAQLHSARNPTQSGPVTFDTKHNPIWKDDGSIGVTKAQRSFFFQPYEKHFETGGYEKSSAEPSLNTCALTCVEPTALATTNTRLDLVEQRSIVKLAHDSFEKNDEELKKNSKTRSYEAATSRKADGGCHSSANDVTRRISSRESHSESERVSPRVNDSHSSRELRRQGALTKLVECHQYCCVDGDTVGSEKIHSCNASSCRSSIQLGFNGNILKPGIVCREQALCKESSPVRNVLADEIELAATKPTEEQNVEANAKAVNRKRLCRSLSNFNGQGLLILPQTSTNETYPAQLQQNAAMSNNKSRIAKLITGHIRSSQNDVVSAENSPKHKKMTKRNINGDSLNGLRKAKSVSDAISELRDDKTSPVIGNPGTKHHRKNTTPVAGNKQRTTNATEETPTNITASRKTPKLPKALFPFMRKNRKRQNSTAATQRQPLKARGLENETEFETTNNDGNKTQISYAENSEPTHRDSDVATVGFRKIKVNTTPARRNIHADYASRVTRVRRKSSSTDKEASANNPDSSSTDRCEGVIMRNKTRQSEAFTSHQTNVRPRRRNKNRLSMELSSTPDCLQSNGFTRTKRPSSFAASTGDQLWLESNMVCAKSDAHIRQPPSDLTPTGQQKDSLEQIETNNLQAKLRNHSVAVCQKMRDDSPIQDKDTHRCSLNLDYLRSGSLTDRLTFIASLPGPETTLGSKSISSSLTGISTPHSTLLTTGGYGSIPRFSLSSSFASVFGDELKQIQNLESTVDVPTATDTPSPEPSPDTQVQPSKMSLRLRRTQSLCRDRLTLKIYETNRRSVSPSFESTNFGPSSTQGQNDGDSNPRQLERRFQSLRDFSTLRSQPIKPTTPKPRKMSSGSSCTSLNRFNFQLSQQNLANNVQPSCPENSTTVTGEPLREFGEMLPKASAKNASIRRRMSLQFLRSMNPDDAKTVSPTATAKIVNGWKRHSLAELDIEKAKVAMAKWSVANNGSSNGNQNNRRRIRPLSEVQNLRWEVHAIPEHNELASPKSPQSTNVVNRPQSLHLKSYRTGAPSGGSYSVVCKGCNTQRTQGTVGKQYEAPLNILGSSFSEENLSLNDDEMLPKVAQPQRSFSVIGGLNTLPPSLMRFYPAKYYAEITCPCRTSGYSNSRNTGHLTPFGHGLHTYFKVRESTMSGISNESGYGTMTRKGGVYARTAEDEDVFLHANSTQRDEQGSNITNEDVLYVEALWDHVTMDNEELGFKVGDVIRVIDMTNSDWWWGELESNEGWFPATFVRILVNQHLHEDVEGIEIIVTPSPNVPNDVSPDSVTRSRSSSDLCQCTERRSNSSIHCSVCGRPLREAHETPKSRSTKTPPKIQEPAAPLIVNTRKQSLCRETIRTNVIEEIVNSEKVFVGHLKDVVQGYLTRCKNRSDMFSDEQISTLFGNIEQIYYFQRDFCNKLENAVNRSCVSSSEIGNIFIEHRDGFAIYSEYCNNHPQALALLSQLLAQKKYMHFFEACRLFQRMIEISLDGFLLTPVQKICKYPLQLAELLKYTSTEHPDNEPVQSALEAMKGVARMINERKRHMENIKKISLWQSSILNWQEEDVLERSSELVQSGEMYTLSQTKGKPKWRMAFLFDHQMIFCKKDILRRDLLYYKSRLDLDTCEIASLETESPRNSSISANDSISGVGPFQRGWKIVDTVTSETATIYCKNEEDFEKWTKAFKMERKLSALKRNGMSKAEEYLAKDLVQKSAFSRRPKASSSVRQPVSYRYRVKMAQGVDMNSKQKNISVPSEKSAGFFSNMAGKLTPFRRTTTRESSFVF
uniref:Uncharacterized protein LOC100183692 n=1 Tax=Phallusia mammillata TaxID=59560 RepID=A0A6F9DH82_9ASCI|nr:uncharacterized protein LOC100183692 [Phallusia mammillata]